MEKFTIEQGKNSSRIFKAEGDLSKTNVEMYRQSPEFFADIIRKNLKPDKEYKIADLGCYGGELLQNIINLLPKYEFKTIGIDRKENLEKNKMTKNKIAADLEQVPLEDKSVDVAIMRYVLQWNAKEKQEKILTEVARIIKKFAVIQHVGADNINPDLWRQKVDRLLGGEISKLKRVGYYYSSRDEIEDWMQKHNISFEKIQDRKIEDFHRVFSERWNFTNKEDKLAKQILGDKNFVIQTSWLIHPQIEKKNKIY